jgi:copper chaperone CopZ
MRLFIFLVLMGVAFSASAQSDAKASSKAVIKTSAQCGMCKEAIEGALAGVAGIESAVLDVTTKKLKVKYDESAITLDDIRTIVSKTGYDADEVPADPKAYAALPRCCQKDGGH